MKKFYSTLAIIAVLVLLTAPSSYSQFRLSLGPNIGMNFNLHTGSDLPESGNGFGIVAGAQVDMMFSRSFGLMTNLQFYDNRFGSYSKSATEPNNGNPVSYTQDYNASVAYFQIEPLAKITTPGGFFFFGGPALGFSVEGSGERVTTLTTPGFQFQDGTTKQTAKGSIDNMNVRFELKLGAGYDIPVGMDMAITPQLSFGYGITNVVKDVTWKILSIQAMATYKFKLI